MFHFGDVMSNLERLERAVSHRAQERLLLEAGHIVANRAKELAPVKTGWLRDSIGVSTHRPTEMSFSIRQDDVRVFIGPAAEVYYAPYVEFGTWKHEGHPFMRPAMDQTRDEVRRAIAHGAWTLIKSSIRV